MQRELRHLVDLIAALKEPARGLVPEIVEAKAFDAQELACARERGPDRLGIVREDQFAAALLAIDDLPG